MTHLPLHQKYLINFSIALPLAIILCNLPLPSFLGGLATIVAGIFLAKISTDLLPEKGDFTDWIYPVVGFFATIAVVYYFRDWINHLNPLLITIDTILTTAAVGFMIRFYIVIRKMF